MIGRLLFNRRLLAVALGFILVAGLAAVQTLPRQEDPRIVARNASIFTFYPGADAERVEALVTRPIEDELRGLDEIKTIESTSRAGASVVSLELRDDITDVTTVWSRVRDKLSDAAPLLPAEASTPDLNDDAGYAFTLAVALRWSAPGAPNPLILGRYGEHLVDRMRNVAGTDYVRLYGAANEEIDVVVDPGAMAAAGLSVDAVARALAQADVRASAGEIDGTDGRYTVEVAGSFDSLARLRRVPLVAEDGRSLQLGDIATLRRGISDPPEELARVDGQRAVVVAVRMGAGQRVDQWVDRAQTVLAAERGRLPAGLTLDVLFEQKSYTEQRLGIVVTSLVQGLAIVVAVLLFTMGWRSALLVGLAIPLTALMTLSVFRPLGLEIHQMSITGMIVALGLMVDNAIVMTNAVREGLAQGRPAHEAVGEALRALTVPLIASTVTTILAFMPIVLLPGGAGEFVGPLSIAVIAALVSSFLVAVFFVPALAPLLLGGPHELRPALPPGPLTRAFRAIVRFSVRRPSVVIVFALALPAIGIASMPTLTQAFFPPAERDQFYIEVRLPPGTSIMQTTAMLEAMDAVVRGTEGVTRTFWFAGTSAPPLYYNIVGREDGNPAYAQAIVNTAGAQLTEALVAQLQPALDAAFPGAQTLVRLYAQGPPFPSPIEVRIYGEELATLASLGNAYGAVLADVPQMTHTQVMVDRSAPKIGVTVDEAQARLAGLDLTAVAAQVAGALNGRSGGFVLEDTEQLPVWVRYPQSVGSDPASLDSLALTVGSGRDGGLPLSAVADVALTPAWGGIQRRDGERVQLVRGFIQESAKAADVQARVDARLARTAIELPPGYRLEWGGEVAERSDAVGGLLASVAMLIVLMVATVAVSLNSFRHTLIVFLAGIQALGLGLLSLKLSGHAFGFVVIVGVMGLVGVAINATIIILSAFQADARARVGDPEAMVDILTGATARHILSTTLTTCGGLMPLALTPGEFWPPFAETVIGGIALSTVIAFGFTPAMHRLLSVRRSWWWQAGGAARMQPGASV